jgi:hypothetical protein
VKSPSEFIELSTGHSRKQFETLTEQITELAARVSDIRHRIHAGAVIASSKGDTP